jgi:hypothetical protein
MSERTVFVKKTSRVRRPDPTPLPQSVRDAVAAGGSVTLPAGEFLLDSPLLISVSNTTVNGTGCTLILPINVEGVLTYTPLREGTGTVWARHRMTGLAEVGTDSFVWSGGSDPPAVNDELWIDVGVSNYDCAEPKFDRVVTVTAVSADPEPVVTFTPPLDKAAPDYVDEAGLTAALLVNTTEFTNKIGEWGEMAPAGVPARGFGGDHSAFVRQGGGRLVHDVTVSGLTVRYPGAENAPSGASGGGFATAYCTDFTLTNCDADDFTGDAVYFMRRCRGYTINGGSVTGTALGRFLGGGVSNTHLVVAWGGGNGLVKDVVCTAANVTLSNLEVGQNDVEFRDVILTSTNTAHRTGPTGQEFSAVAGTDEMEDIRYVRCVLDIPGENGRLFNARNNRDGMRLVDCEFVGPSPDGWTSDPTNLISWATDYLSEVGSTVTFDGETYGPPEPFEVIEEVSAGVGYAPLPAGIYLTCEVSLSSLVGVTDVAVAGQSIFDGDITPAPLNRLGIPVGFPVLPPGFDRMITVTTGSPVTVTATGTYLPRV